ELKEDAFALVLRSRKPGRLAAQRSTANADFEFALNVWSRGFEPRESHLCDHFTKSMDKHDSLDLLRPVRLPFLSRQRAGEKRTMRLVIAKLLFGRDQRFQFRLLDALSLFGRPLGAGENLGEYFLVAEILKDSFHFGLTALVAKLVEVLDGLQRVPNRIDYLLDPFVAVGE